MEQFLVEGPDAKAIGRWLSKPIRDALLDFPDAWLFVQDRAMALAVYGPVDADRMEELVIAADAIFAEHGNEGAPSLLFDGSGDDYDDDSEEDEEDGGRGGRGRGGRGRRGRRSLTTAEPSHGSPRRWA